MNRILLTQVACAVLAGSAPASASLTIYDGNFDGWSAAVGAVTKVGFDDLAPNEWVTTQYASLGITFGFGDPDIHDMIPGTFIDGHGIDGNCVVDMRFGSPIYGFGAVFPGLPKFQLYLGSTLVESTGFFVGSPGHFTGVATTTAFDRVLMSGTFVPPPFPCSQVAVDDVYFQTIPAPPSAAAMLIAVLTAGRRSRRR